MRIIVLGAGAVGSVYGALLSRRHDVTLVAADGVHFDDDFIAIIAHNFGKSKTIVSTLQDLLQGQAHRDRFLNGAVVGLGERYRIACPVNQALTTIIKQMEKASIKAIRPAGNLQE